MNAHRVQFAPEAVEQLESLFHYIAERASPATALRYAQAVVETCEGLSSFPLRGVAREDIRPGLRLTHHRGRTMIAYAVDDPSQTVSIVGIFHGGQDHESALAGRGQE